MVRHSWLPLSNIASNLADCGALSLGAGRSPTDLQPDLRKAMPTDATAGRVPSTKWNAGCSSSAWRSSSQEHLAAEKSLIAIAACLCCSSSRETAHSSC